MPDQAEHVGLELPANLVERHRLDGARLAVAGVVDQHADGALGLGHRVDGGAHRGLVGHVEGERLAALLGESAIVSGLRAVAYTFQPPGQASRRWRARCRTSSR